MNEVKESESDSERKPSYYSLVKDLTIYQLESTLW